MFSKKSLPFRKTILICGTIFCSLGLLSIASLLLWWHLSICQYFHLASGNITTAYQLGDMVLYSTDNKSKISGYLSHLPVTLPDKTLKIAQKRNATFYCLKNYKCYSDLLELFIENSLQVKESKQLQQAADDIVKKYGL